MVATGVAEVTVLFESAAIGRTSGTEGSAFGALVTSINRSAGNGSTSKTRVCGRDCSRYPAVFLLSFRESFPQAKRPAGKRASDKSIDTMN